jgi:cytoskeletal protein RodZ
MNTLLIIDEAQHLQPEVLEQLRLLTNLETNTKKLLQVILIGQPELQQLLQRRDLRQLAQRITARYHLMPLNKSELAQYISHRLLVADCTRALFDRGAIAKIHQLSQGVPRLTNLLCHSALMLAYNQNDSVINKKTVVAAAERALGSDLTQNKNNVNYNGWLVLSSVVSLCAFVGLASFWWGQTQVPITIKNADKAVTIIEENEQIVQDVSASLPDDFVDISSNKSEAINALAEESPASETDKSINEKNESVEKATVIASQPVIKKTTNPVKAKTEKLPEQLTVSATKKPQVRKEKDFTLSEVEGVSDDLLARFQAAIEATKFDDVELDTSKVPDDVNSDITDNDRLEVKPLTQMSQQLQNALPSLQFEQHIYASDSQGWVNVNGRDRYEGDYISDNLLVEKILPQQVILSFNGEKFSLPALTNW